MLCCYYLLHNSIIIFIFISFIYNCPLSFCVKIGKWLFGVKWKLLQRVRIKIPTWNGILFKWSFSNHSRAYKTDWYLLGCHRVTSSSTKIIMLSITLLPLYWYSLISTGRVWTNWDIFQPWESFIFI